jgi:hypothetical protein
MSDTQQNRRSAAVRFLELAEKITDPKRHAKAVELAAKWARSAQEPSRDTHPPRDSNKHKPTS